MKSKKGQSLGGLQNVVWLLVVIGIMLAIGLVVLSELYTTMEDPAVNSTASEAQIAINETVSAISSIPQWLPIVVIVIIAAIILGLVSIFKGRQA